MDEAVIARISQEALSLRERYDDDALSALLDAEQTRLQQDEVLTLTAQPGKELVLEFLEKFKDSLVEHREFTVATTSLMVPALAKFLADKALIDPANISLSQFVISVFLALVVGALLDSAHKKSK